MKNAPIDFSRYASAYDNKKDFDRYLLHYKFLTLKAYRPKFGDTLELGCAMGLMTELIAPHATSLDVVDASGEYIAETKRVLLERFPKRMAQFEFYTTLFQRFHPTQKYDTIVMSGVLPALPNPVRFLAHVSKWLKPKGVIFITSHNAYSLHRRIGKAMGLIKNVHELSERDRKLFGHRKVYDLDSLERDIVKSGLIVREKGGIFLKPFPNAKMEELTDTMIHAFYVVGKEVDPRLNAELYAIAGLK